MTEVLQQYSHQHYQSLLDVDTASREFVLAGGIGQLERYLAHLVRKHPEAVKGLGIQLLHRHCSLRPDEVMLASGPTTFPIKVADIAAETLENVRPTVWGLKPGSDAFVPLEFVLAEDGAAPVPELDAPMAKDLAILLKAYGLDRKLGIAVLPTVEGQLLERTFDRANVLMPASAFLAADKYVDVLWAMETIDSMRNCRLRCRISCTSVQGYWTKHVKWHDDVHDED